jgi:hypothetical protein
MQRWEIINVTGKRPVFNEHGEDMRPIKERQACGVNCVLPSGRNINLSPGKRVTVDESVGEGILNLQKQGFITVRPAKSLQEELANYAARPRENEVNPKEELRVGSEDLQGNASEMGAPVVVPEEEGENKTLKATSPLKQGQQANNPRKASK